ncbi:hypothetical protein K432DRAFT_391312 [Lepidopterella palustris CBS 459.81]|uniref:Uncharacterized protein n=1 Tax=Lepidopterella palustris CBS 459.81 TaxID=1314670 RepID=A0A8E2EE48_9PEZI|nr:hypothetical protein K432DRAFT_391312 [Lepidopterella palustris CBS 459.81]
MLPRTLPFPTVRAGIPRRILGRRRGLAVPFGLAGGTDLSLSAVELRPYLRAPILAQIFPNTEANGNGLFLDVLENLGSLTHDEILSRSSLGGGPPLPHESPSPKVPPPSGPFSIEPTPILASLTPAITPIGAPGGKPDNRPDHSHSHDGPKSENEDLDKQPLKFEWYGLGNKMGVYLDSDSSLYKVTFEKPDEHKHDPHCKEPEKPDGYPVPPPYETLGLGPTGLPTTLPGKRFKRDAQGPETPETPPLVPGDYPSPYSIWNHGRHDYDRTFELWGTPAVPHGCFTDQLAFMNYKGSSLRHIEDVFRDGKGGFIGIPPWSCNVEPDKWETEGPTYFSPPSATLLSRLSGLSPPWWRAQGRGARLRCWVVYWFDGKWEDWQTDKMDDEMDKFERVKILAIPAEDHDHGHDW